MTNRQIRALNTMCGNTKSFEVMYAGSLVVLSVVSSYDLITNRGHWFLSYGSYISDLYSHRDISPYDKGVLRYMYTEYYNDYMCNTTAI